MCSNDASLIRTVYLMDFGNSASKLDLTAAQCVTRSMLLMGIIHDKIYLISPLYAYSAEFLPNAPLIPYCVYDRLGYPSTRTCCCKSSCASDMLAKCSLYFYN